MIKDNFFIGRNIVCDSDWHLMHKNIVLYEFEKRKIYINQKWNIKTKEDLEYFYNNSTKEDINNFLIDLTNNFLKIKYESMKKIIKENNILTYYNLGDFTFNINRLVKNIEMFPYLTKFFQLLNDNKIKTILIFGNHDDISNKKYNDFFNEVKFGEKISTKSLDIVLTHFPVKRKNTLKERFQIIENELLENINKTILNIHGHGHSKSLPESENNEIIIFQNVSIENLN